MLSLRCTKCSKVTDANATALTADVGQSIKLYCTSKDNGCATTTPHVVEKQPANDPPDIALYYVLFVLNIKTVAQSWSVTAISKHSRIRTYVGAPRDIRLVLQHAALEGYVTCPKRGHYRITDAGKRHLNSMVV